MYVCEGMLSCKNAGKYIAFSMEKMTDEYSSRLQYKHILQTEHLIERDTLSTLGR